jgi:hypothetical protein
VENGLLFGCMLPHHRRFRLRVTQVATYRIPKD